MPRQLVLTVCLVLTGVATMTATASAASYRGCSGTYVVKGNGLGLSSIKQKRVSCSTARKTTNSWGGVWASSGYKNVVRFRRVHTWRCVYRFKSTGDGGYGRVICVAGGGLRVAFRVLS